jgi:hypothetical protein
MVSSPTPIRILIPIETLRAQSLLSVFLSIIWSEFLPESLVQLSLQHSGASLSCIPTLFQILPTNQFQRRKTHMVRFSCHSNHISLVPIFCITQTFTSLLQIPERNNLREEGFILTHSFRGYSPPWQSHITVNRSQHRTCLHLWGSSFFPFHSIWVPSL